MFIPFLKVKLEGKQNETCPRRGGGASPDVHGKFSLGCTESLLHRSHNYSNGLQYEFTE